MLVKKPPQGRHSEGVASNRGDFIALRVLWSRGPLLMVFSLEFLMIYEVRFQKVDPKRRAEYLKVYREAIQPSKKAGCDGGWILCDEEDPSAVMVVLAWETREHHLRWRGTPDHKAFRDAVAPWQSESTGSYYMAEAI